MPPYKKMYLHLFNTITDALREMDKGNYTHAHKLLTDAQRWSEDRYIEAGEKTDNSN